MRNKDEQLVATEISQELSVSPLRILHSCGQNNELPVYQGVALEGEGGGGGGRKRWRERGSYKDK